MSYLCNEYMLFRCRISARCAGDLSFQFKIIRRFPFRSYTTKQESKTLVVLPKHILIQRTPNFLLSQYQFRRKEKVIFTAQEWDQQITLFLHSASDTGSFLRIMTDAQKRDHYDLIWRLLYLKRDDEAFAILSRIFQNAQRKFALKMGLLYIGKLAEIEQYFRVFRLFRLFAIPRLISNRFTSQKSFTSLLNNLQKLISTQPKHAVEQVLQILLLLAIKEGLVENGLNMIKKSIEQGYQYPEHFIDKLIDAVLHSGLPIDTQVEYLIKMSYFHKLHLSPTTVDSFCRRLALDRSFRLRNLTYNHLHQHNIVMPMSFLVDSISLNCQNNNSSMAWKIYDRLPHPPSPIVTVEVLRALSKQNNLNDIAILFSKHIAKLDLNDPQNQRIVHEILAHAAKHKDFTLASQVTKYLIRPLSHESYSLLLALQLSSGKTSDSVEIIAQMRQDGIQPSLHDHSTIFVSLLKEDPERGFAVAQESPESLTYGSWCAVLAIALEMKRQDIADWVVSRLGGREKLGITAFNAFLKPLSFEEAKSEILKRGRRINYITLRTLLHKAKEENRAGDIFWTIDEMKRRGWRPSGGEVIPWVNARTQAWRNKLENASPIVKRAMAPGFWIYNREVTPGSQSESSQSLLAEPSEPPGPLLSEPISAQSPAQPSRLDDRE